MQRSFFLDHSAGSSSNGFVIITKENCVKSVTGWSRFEFSLSPQEEKIFFVQEEANYEQNLPNSQLSNFVLRIAPPLLEQKLLSNEILQSINQMITQQQYRASLEKIRSNSVNETDLNNWKNQDKTLLPSSLLKSVSLKMEYEARQAEIQRLITNHEEYIKKVFVNQQRLRENIKSLEKIAGQSNKLVERYLSDLNLQEDDLNRIKKLIEELEQEKNKNELILKQNNMSIQTETKKLLDELS